LARHEGLIVDAAKKKPPAIDLAVVLGGGKPSMHDEPDADDMGGKPDGDEDDAMPAGFSQAAEEAFDPERSPEERTAALYRAIKACTEGY
jgi:ABC-type branched-subunit amino acid transport system substrate-binding protein